MGSPNVISALTTAPARFLIGRWPWLALIYLLFSGVVGLALLVLLPYTLLLLPLWGILIGMLERRRTSLLGFSRQSSGHVRVDAVERHHWLSIRITERATWREVLALVLDLVMGIGAVFIVFFEFIGIAVLVGAAATGLDGPREMQFIGPLRAVMTPQNWWVTIPIGLVWLCILAYLNAVYAGVQAAALRRLCGPRQQELAQTVRALIRSRRSLAEAAEAERRRIERNLHDGVQQELAVLGAQLGMVAFELEELDARGVDVSGALRSASAARVQSERVMVTLRDSVRAIHPAVLTDHGLNAALEELADRHPTPVTLHLAPSESLPPVIETAAYYLVSEALTNITKHADSTAVDVDTNLGPTTFTITVTDDGCGGAESRTGHGLAGLHERAEALSGQFDIDSPAGGPTVLRMEIPLDAEDPHEEGTAHAGSHR